MDDRTQLNRNINATMLNSQIAKDSATDDGQMFEREINVPGEIFDEKYVVKSKMDVSTGEADLYICSDGVSEFVVKIYRRKMAVKEEITEVLKAIDSPYVAKVFATGERNGFHYEIIPYYENGSLEGKKFSYEQLKSTIIPALNEGLKVLHEKGIIHKDLKPSNIMLGDNGQDVAIIDFGISSVREDGNTVIVTRTGMTPEYSAPETFKSLYLSESDYYSLGITLYELYCGHTPYELMNQDEIEQFVSVQKLPLPSDMRSEMKVLISALTYSDITNRKNKSNPNRRWGYEEVLKWCVGIKQPVPGEGAETTILSEDIRPYRFLGETYTEKQKLVAALADHWKDGKKQLFRGLLSAYFKEFDAEIAGFCMDAEEEVAEGDEDLIFFRTLYKIDPSMTCFQWKGKRYEDLSLLGNEFLNGLWTNQEDVCGFVGEILEKGVFSQYALCMGEGDTPRANAIKAIESAYRTFQDDSREKTVNSYLLAYMLSGRKVLNKAGVKFESVQDLTGFLKAALERSYSEFEEICFDLIDYGYELDAQFESWLIALGNKEKLDQWKKEMD